MPLYDHKCNNCGSIQEVFLKVEELDLEKPQNCVHCKSTMRRLIGKRVNVVPDWEPYIEENFGHEAVYVKSRQHYKELCDHYGVRCVG